MALVVSAIAPQLGPWPDRLVHSIVTPGVLEPTGSFQVTAPGGMFVRVGSGTPGDLAAVRGAAAGQGVYMVVNPDGFYDAPGDIPISPGDPSNPRIDLIVIRVEDSEWDSSGQQRAIIDVVEGTPASTPSAPAVPDSCIALAQVAVAANESTAIIGGNLTDRRVRCQIRNGGAPAVDDRDLVPFSHLRDYVAAALAVPYLIRTRSGTSQTIGPLGSPQTASLNSVEDADAQGVITSTAATTTITRAGLWEFAGGMRLSGNATGIRGIYLTVNGGLIAAHVQSPPGTGAFDMTVGPRLFRLGPGTHTFELQVLQTSGADLDLVNASRTFRSCRFVRD